MTTTTDDSRAQIKWVTQNHQLVPYAEATISVMAPGLTFAALVFEGFRAYWNAEASDLMIFRLDDHLKRLAYSLSVIEMDDPPSSDAIAADILATLKANEFREDTYIRVQIYVDDWGSMTATGPVGSSVICRPRPRVANFETGQKFITSSWRRNTENASPSRIKASGNYLNSRLAGLEAKRQGAGGAVMLNEDGSVSEGPGGCIFLLRDGVFHTPDVTSGILESITRDTILKIGVPLGIPMVERKIGRTELYLAEEVFYCGTGQEIMPITAFDGRPVGDGAPGPLTRKLQSRYDDVVRGKSDQYSDWSTPAYGSAV